MPPTQEIQEQPIPTSAGMETATQTVDRIKGALGNVNASNVPMSVVSTPTPAIALPPAPVIPTDTGAVAEGRTLLDQETERARTEADRASQTVSDSERAVRESLGILQTEDQSRTQLEQQAGVAGFSQDIRKFQESLRRQVAELDQFDVDNVNTLEQMRVDASRRDITKRTFSAQSAEANIQLAVERANRVASARATIAAIDISQGNLQQATEQVDKALKAIYEPVRQQLQMEMFFLERNDTRFDSAQKDLANSRMMEILREQAQMDRAINLSDSAVASGYASSDDIQNLVNLSSDPAQQAAYAVQILGKGARAAVSLENAIKGRQYELLGLEIQSENFKILSAVNASENGVLTPEQFTVANDLRKEVNNMQEVKDAKDLEGNTASLIAALAQENGVGDISAINSFQRLVVDPGVAVREGDVALLQSAMSFTDEATLRAKGLIKGDKLTPEARQQMKDLVEDVYRIRVELVDRNTSQVRTIAQEQGIDYGKYIGNTFETFEQLQSKALQTKAVEFGLPVGGDEYLDTVTNTLLQDSFSNPFGINLN